MQRCVLLRIVIDYDELCKLPLGYGVGPLVANMLRDLAMWLISELVHEGEWHVKKFEAREGKDIIELVHCGLGEQFPSLVLEKATHIIDKHMETYEDIADILVEDAKRQLNQLLEKLEWTSPEVNAEGQIAKTCLQYNNARIMCLEAREILVAGQVL